MEDYNCPDSTHKTVVVVVVDADDPSLAAELVEMPSLRHRTAVVADLAENTCVGHMNGSIPAVVVVAAAGVSC